MVAQIWVTKYRSWSLNSLECFNFGGPFVFIDRHNMNIKRFTYLLKIIIFSFAKSYGAFGRAPRADSLLNLVGALPNNFLERSGSMLIL